MSVAEIMASQEIKPHRTPDLSAAEIMASQEIRQGEEALLLNLMTNLKLTPKSNGAVTLFDKLPPEIRIRIWKFVLHSPRLVHLHISKGPDFSIPKSREIKLGRAVYFKSDQLSLLQICRESRTEALRLGDFKACVSSRLKAPLYLDLNLDTLVLSSWGLKIFFESDRFSQSKPVPPSKLPPVKYLAVYDGAVERLIEQCACYLGGAIRSFRSLEEIAIIVEMKSEDEQAKILRRVLTSVERFHRMELLFWSLTTRQGRKARDIYNYYETYDIPKFVCLNREELRRRRGVTKQISQ